MFILDPDLDFLPIPDPGIKKAPDPESRIWICNTDFYNLHIMNAEGKFFCTIGHHCCPLCEPSVLNRFVYKSLSEVQIKREEEIFKNPLSRSVLFRDQ
jgi:hypothetical protein